MTKLDLAIRVGTVVTASDTFRADVGILDGRIVAVAAEIEEPPARDDAQRAFRSRARSICSTTLPIFSPIPFSAISFISATTVSWPAPMQPEPTRSPTPMAR